MTRNKARRNEAKAPGSRGLLVRATLKQTPKSFRSKAIHFGFLSRMVKFTATSSDEAQGSVRSRFRERQFLRIISQGDWRSDATLGMNAMDVLSEGNMN